MVRLLRLDCSNPATTRASLAMIFGVDPEEVERQCRGLDVASHPEDPSRSVIASLFGGPVPADELEVVYFHPTRVFPSRRSFSEGLLPLGSLVDVLWADLYDLVGEECDPAAWAEFRTWVERGDVPYPVSEPPNELARTDDALDALEQFRRAAGDVATQRARALYRRVMDYRERMRSPDRWGPGGFLIRAVALGEAAEVMSREQGHPLPIVEDIAAAFAARFHGDLLTAYLRVTRRYLVKFCDVRPAGSALEVAARYLCLAWKIHER